MSDLRQKPQVHFNRNQNRFNHLGEVKAAEGVEGVAEEEGEVGVE